MYFPCGFEDKRLRGFIKIGFWLQSVALKLAVMFFYVCDLEQSRWRIVSTVSGAVGLARGCFELCWWGDVSGRCSHR